VAGIPLAAGAALGALLAATGVVVTKRSTGPLPAASDLAVRRRYSITVGLEFGLLGAGAAVLGATGHYQGIPVWICFGVGVHFFPLASTLQNPTLRRLGALLVAVAAAALVAGLATAVAPSTVTGAGAGLCLCCLRARHSPDRRQWAKRAKHPDLSRRPAKPSATEIAACTSDLGQAQPARERGRMPDLVWQRTAAHRST
jgi:hypothetical protein